MKKRLISTILSLAMIGTMLMGCGNSSSTASGQVANASGGSSAASEASETSGSGDVTKLVIAYSMMGNSSPDMDAVVEKANEYTREKIGVEVELMGIAGMQASQQIQLMLAANQKLDLVCTGTIYGGQFMSQVANGQLAPLDDLLKQYGQGVLSSAGDLLGAATVNGKIYAVPSIRDEAKASGIAIRTDLVNKYNLDLSNIKDVDDITPILKTIHDNEPDLYTFHPGQGNNATIDQGMRIQGGDFLGSSDYFSGVLMDATKADTPLVDFYETDTYKHYVEVAREWSEAGYLIPGTTTITDNPPSYVKNGKLAGYLLDIKPGIEQQAESNCGGVDMTIAQIGPAVKSTDTVSSFMWAIPQGSECKEKAMAYLNLMYTDPYLINLIDYGIEGQHYIKNDDGTIGYPEGVTASSVSYSPNIGFIWGNQLLSYVFEGNDKNVWEEMKKFNDDAIESAAFGFVFDSTPVKTEYAACTSVVDKYSRALGQGGVDADSTLEQFISELKAAGVDKVVAEKQSQFDSWKASK